MKRTLWAVTTFLLAVLAPSVLLAQSNPLIGTWKQKVDPADSKFTRTLTYKAHGDGVKASATGTGEDGSRFAYSYTANYDGKDYPVSGTGIPGDADTVSLKRVDGNSADVTWKKAGKVLLTGRYAISKDGKIMTVAVNATDENGKPVTGSFVMERQ